VTGSRAPLRFALESVIEGRFAAVYERAKDGVLQMTPSELQLFLLAWGEIFPALKAIAQLRRWINERLLRHAVVARYALDRTVDAQEVIEQGTHIGNVVVTI